MIQDTTIVAQATPNGIGALAIIRISGNKTVKIVEKILTNRERFLKASPRTMIRCTVIDLQQKKEIDEILAVKYVAPHSFTGEDMVEMFCHGSPVIVRKIIQNLISIGAVMAGRGEFTRRALIRGKINLLQAEAIQAMIESTNDADIFCANKLLKGENKKLSELWSLLSRARSDIEALIEFGEEIDEEKEKKKVKENIDRLIEEIKKDLKRREKISGIENGIKIVIAGPANAGKSTLFNTLLGYDRALIHDDPGTTRDSITERIYINNHDVQLIDSAGFRQTNNEVEKKGIQKSKSAIHESPIIIWVSAANEKWEEKENETIEAIKGKKRIGVINKCDLDSGKKKENWFKDKKIPVVQTSLKKTDDIKGLLKLIENNIDAIIETIETPHLLFNKRHENVWKRILKDIETAQTEIETGRVEFAAQYLREAQKTGEEIFGAIDNEKIINEIFDKFCIGK